ncbi:hypothetical protein EI94DRAFT_1789687 [Lactarius quietus]|nr:hypothetical protein EI94DRAFT_1789687 [Lactarius quietus]
MLPFFALASGFLYVGKLLLRGLLRFRTLREMATHITPSLCSPHPAHLLEAPIVPLVTTPTELIVIEPLIQPSAIPTLSYQSSLVTVTQHHFLDLTHILLLLAFISAFVFLLPGLIYVFATIANKISAFSRLSRKNSKASSFKSIFSLVPVFSSLVPLFSLVPNLFSTRIFSLRLLVSFVSFLLLWTESPAIASFVTLIFIIFKLSTDQKFSNIIVNILQRCGLLTLPDTRTPPVLTAIYEQIVNKTVTYKKFIWRRNPPSGPKQDQTPIFPATNSHLELQYREQELLNLLTQHKLELEQEKEHRLRTQQVYSAFADTQKSIRRQLDVSRTREGKLKADLHAAEKERKKLKDLIATLEASDVVLRADLAATEDETREAAIIFDQQSKVMAEKDHVIRSTNKDLFVARADLQDAVDRIARLDAELESERKLRIGRTKELDEQVKSRRLYEAEMRLIAKKTEDVQSQLDLLDNLLSQSRDRTQSLLDDAHTPSLTNYAVVITPDDTGQPPPPLPPPPLQPDIPDVRTPPLDPIAKLRPVSPKSLRRTPERNPHDPTTLHSPDHPRQISAWLGRVSDSANSWRAGVERLLETISQLGAERTREAGARERSERELTATKDELGVTQGELTSTMEELGVTQEELASTMEELGVTQDELTATKESLSVTQEEASKANRELDLERETLQNTRAHAEKVTRELKLCKARMKRLQEARRAGIEKFRNAVRLLHQRSADLVSLKAEVEASKFKHPGAVSLSAVLRKRAEILEAEVNSLSLSLKSEEMHLAHADSPLFCSATKDPTPATHSVELPSLDSPPPPPPPPTPPSFRNISPFSNPLKTIFSLDNVPSSLGPLPRLDLSTARHPLVPPFRLGPSRESSLAFSPVGSSVGSVDWPPIGSTLQPSGKNVEQDGGVNILKTLPPRLPLQEADNTSSISRNPLNLPLPQIMISRPLDFSGSVRFGVQGSTLFRPTNAATAGRLAPPSRLRYELFPGSHCGDLSSHTPPGSPPPMPEQNLNRSTSSPEPPLPRLLPGLLDPVLAREHAVLNEDSPCIFSKPKRGRRPNQYRAFARPYIPTIDFGLPKGFIPSTECGIEPPDLELDNAWANDFAFFLPSDCPSSTPIVTSRRLTSNPSPEPDTKFPSFGHSPPRPNSPE